MGLKASLSGGYLHRFCLSEVKDNRVTTLYFSPFAVHQMYSEALYFAERDLRPPPFNFKNQFSSIIAFKSKAEGASLWLVCHVPFPLISSH